MATHRMVQNDTAPNLIQTISIDGSNDLTGCTVRFKIKDPESGQTNTGHDECTILDISTGQVEYNFQEGDIPSATTYTCDWEITFFNGKVWTYPVEDKIVARAENG